MESEFKHLKDIKYFDFEEDFIEKNIRCIPMIVRFKMDAVGIKLKLADWIRFTIEERKELALKECETDKEKATYNTCLSELIKKYSDKEITEFEIDKSPSWKDKTTIPLPLQEKASEFNQTISVAKWEGLTDLQRFALLKLAHVSHESKNFPKALKEFNLYDSMPFS